MYDISIVVPVYNVEVYLDKCLKTLISQSIFQNIQVVLVDDGSLDKSGEICEAYSRNYSNIIVIHQENAGVSSARNTGINNASGKYIAFVDADDYVKPDFYETMLNAIKWEKVDLVVCDYWLMFDNEQIIRYRKKRKPIMWDKEAALKEFLSGGMIGVNLFDKLFDQKIISDLRFKEDIKIGEDLYFIFEYLLKSSRTYGCFYPGYYYVQRENSAMRAKFSEKYFDVITVSNWIKEKTKIMYPALEDYSNALLIHSEYKTLERAYKFKGSINTDRRLEQYENDLKKYSIVSAARFLSKKQFMGFYLMRSSPKLYLLICKVLKI